MRKLVFVASDPPMPPTGGGNRAYHLLMGAAKGANTELVLLFPVKKEALPVEVIAACSELVVTNVTFGKPLLSVANRIKEQLRVLIAPGSISNERFVVQADYYANHPYQGTSFFKRFLYTLIRKRVVQYGLELYANGYAFPARSLERFRQFQELEGDIKKRAAAADLLWIDFSFLLPFFNNWKKEMPHLQIVCNAHNLEYVFLEQLAAQATDVLQKQWLEIQARSMKKAELEGFANCDLVITCSASDKDQLLKKLPLLPVAVVPNGVDTHYFQPEPLETNVPTILFTGTMTYTPNRDAVHYFISEIFPLIRLKIPSCVFVAAGAHAAAMFPEYADRKDIELADSPADMRPYYNKAGVVVVPLQSGSGTRLKILEAMAMRKPIVSTSIGAEGLDVLDGESILLADTAEEFAQMILTVLEDDGLSEKISNSSYEIAHVKYDWNLIRNTVQTLLREVSVD